VERKEATSVIKSVVETKDMRAIVETLKFYHPILSNFHIETVNFLVNSLNGIKAVKQGEEIYSFDNKPNSVYLILFGKYEVQTPQG